MDISSTLGFSVLLTILKDVVCNSGDRHCLPYGVEFESRCIWSKDTEMGKGLFGSQALCEAYGGKLATFSNLEEVQNMKTAAGIGQQTRIIIGVKLDWTNNSRTMTWLHTASEPFFAMWDNITFSGGLNDTCLALVANHFQIIPCDTEIRFLCERDLNSSISTPMTTSETKDGCTTPDLEERDKTYTIAPTSYVLIPNLRSTRNPAPPTMTMLNLFPGTPLAPKNGLSNEQVLERRLGRVLKQIEKVDVKNLSLTDVKVMVKDIGDIVTAARDTQHVRQMIGALVQLSDMKSCDKETFKSYATSMSTLVSRLTLRTDKQKSPDQSEKQPGPMLILDAMEHMIMVTNLTRASFVYQSFSVRIEWFKGGTDKILLESEDKKNEIRIDSSVFSSGKGRISTVVYKDLQTKLDGRSRYGSTVLDSSVISVAIQDSLDTAKTSVNAPSAINFTVRHEPKQGDHVEKSRICAFWSRRDSEWSDTGCRLLAKNGTHTACTCDHLTSFAVLVLYDDTLKLSDVDEKALFILSALGCSLSILGLAMTLISFIYLRLLRRERYLIHANLAVSLMLAQIIFVASSEAKSNPLLCKIVAILMHFFFMSAFTWMMLEGLCLYLSCLKSQYNFGDLRLKYTIIGWVVPITIIVISAASQFPSYGHGPGDSCWLSAERGLIWAFMAPMLLIVIFNLIILGLVIRVFLTLKANSQKSEVARVRASLRAMTMLLPLLGVTWLLSVLVPYSAIFQYLFVIGNSLQGLMIFFLHCLCNEEVRKFLAAKRSSPTSATSDIDVSVVRRRAAPYQTFDDVKTKVPGADPPGRRHAWI